MEQELNEEQLAVVYDWVDEVPLSRPKRNMPRDFSDAGILALIQYCLPR